MANLLSQTPFNAAITPVAAPEQEAKLRERVICFLHAQVPHGLDQLRVEVDGNCVTLRGDIASAHARWLCTNCCRRVAGVLRVIDETTVAGETSPAARPSTSRPLRAK